MITLQFSRQADPVSAAIAWFTQGHLSHVDAVMPGGLLLGARADDVGGSPPGVHHRNPDYVKWAEVVQFHIPASEEQAFWFQNFLHQQLGKPYDHTAIWGFALGRDWREDDSWICSELQAAALEYARVVPKMFLADNKISPNSLALAVSAIYGVKHEWLMIPKTGTRGP